MVGWTGQAEAPGYAIQVLANRLADPGAVRMVQRSLDFLATAEFYPGGFHNWYDFKVGCRLGQILGREDLKRLALLMYRSCGQLIDPYGSQGEQMQHTNYGRSGTPAAPLAVRGGYNERWMVFWITPHFLTGAARFTELAAPIW